MAHAEPAAWLAVEVLYCARPGHTDSVHLQLPQGSSLGAALQASGLLARYGLQMDELSVGVWTRVQPVQTLLRDRDRVEIYRPLQVDPKEARRQRYGLHKARLQAAKTSSNSGRG